jgi:formylglycine-generating enzyme required for sulfatase activity
MIYCINPNCLDPSINPTCTSFCISCGNQILLKDRYRVQKILGQGGFGKTFKAVDEHQVGSPPCVIKQFAFGNNNPQIKETALKLFYEEARHLELLGKHSNIPELIAYFDIEGQPYLIQQFIDGQDLEKELAVEGVFDQNKVRKLLTSLLQVLDFLHKQPIPVIHRDIKPANIIRQWSDNDLVLVDFGAAKQATRTMLGKTGTVIGSPEYTAPEQTRGKATFASDIYSLGVTCIHLLTQISPFELFDINQDAWVWRDYLVNNPVDEDLGRILDRMIVNSLPQRYKMASDVLAELDSPQTTVIPVAVINNQPILHLFEFDTARIRIEEAGGLWGHTKVVLEKSRMQARHFLEDFRENVNLEMVEIPGGSFLMGSLESELESDGSERPQHKVSVPSFHISKYSITTAQYQTVMKKDSYKKEHGSYPMKCSWDDAVAFCEKLSIGLKRNYRLPSEAQWEYACRAKTTTPFYFGETIDKELANYNASTAYGRGEKNEDGFNHYYSKEGGRYPANSYGLYDMHGNLEEWCADSWHKDYTFAPIDGSAWISTTTNEYVLRGGSCHSTPGKCRSSSRSIGYSSRAKDIGFRVVSY